MWVFQTVLFLFDLKEQTPSPFSLNPVGFLGVPLLCLRSFIQADVLMNLPLYSLQGFISIVIVLNRRAALLTSHGNVFMILEVRQKTI